MSHYPETAGYKQPRTSKDAAIAVEPKAKVVREAVLALLANTPLTPDECADALGESILTVRPRCSELLKQGLLVETDLRRKNASGRFAYVLKVKPTEPEQGSLF